MQIPLWLSVALSIAAGLTSARTMWYALELKREMRRSIGDTREDTVLRIRAQVMAMRKAYRLQPGDQFAYEMQAAVDKLERTMNRLQRDEWQAVRHD